MQFGHTLHHVLEQIVYANPCFGPVKLIKIDLADEYYQVPLGSHRALQLAVVLPANFQDPLIAIPLTLPMGWNESLPYFCMCTETIADITNHQLVSRVQPPWCPHPQEHLANVNQHECLGHMGRPLVGIVLPRMHLQQRPLTCADVYLDDFIGLAQTLPDETWVHQHLMYNINDMFNPNTGQEHICKEPTSDKQLTSGDASWCTNHTILQWDLDTTCHTLELPAHWSNRLHQTLRQFPATRTWVSVCYWKKLISELCSMVPGIMGGRALFSTLQWKLKTAKNGQVLLNPNTHQCLQD